MSHEVLIIDDDPVIHAMVGMKLGGGQTDWISAFDGRSGLTMAANRKPDLILLDVDMPDLDGYQVCKRLKSNPATLSIPILFLSAAASRDEKVLGLDMGAVDYVTKPFDPYELRARTEAALRTKSTVDRISSTSLIDEVTGLYNGAYLDRQMPAVLAQARRWGRRLGCILVELDHFETIRGEIGRAGAEVLQQNIADALVQTCRAGDTLCRYGEGQFAVLAFATDIATSVELADRMLAHIQTYGASLGNVPTRLTASCGVALSPLTGRQEVMKEAQEALDQARRTGGNCVRSAGEPAFPALRLRN